MTEHETIQDFLNCRRLAVAGVSANEKEFSRVVYRELKSRGYDLVPIHPSATEIEQDACFARLQDVSPPPEGVLLFTRPAVSEQVVRDCSEAGVRRVWFHRSVGPGSISDAAVAYCRDQGMNVIAGQCPMMFLSNTAWPHRFHAFLKKLTGSYPR